MPVRHRELGDELAPPQPKRCRHCDENRSSCGSGGDSEGSEGRESWRVTLDHDLVETLSAIYPEWFKPQQRRERGGPASPVTPVSPLSTPRTPTSTSDDAFSWGAESDMAGRAGSSGSGASEPASSPPRVSPPKVVVDDSPLQPAMGKHKESLKVKLMMRRPINQLVAQGIMPPLKTPPAYFEQCKQLERAKTGDLLKAKIQKRPDRQELERRHILEQESHVDPSLAEKQRMLKKARLADQLNDQLSHRPGPLELIKKNILHTEETIETAVKSGTVAFRATSEGASARPQHPSSYCGPPEELSPSPSPPQHPAPGKDKNRKKNKQKHHQPKARFKFHEYKGPPSAHKAAAAAAAAHAASPPQAGDDTPYDLLLQQQQMLLQLMLPASPAASIASSVQSDCSDALPAPPPPPPPPPALNGAGAAVPVARFEDMKVSDLRAECKRRNLRVSGPKPQLLDRLRPFLLGAGEREEAPRSPLSVASVASAASVASVTSPEPEAAEDIVQSQRRQIEELERKLEASRQQLEAVRRDAAGAAASDQSRRLLQAHLCVSQLRAQLDALQQPAPPPAPPAQPPHPPPHAPHATHTAHAARIVLADATPERLVRLFAVSPPGAEQDASGKQNPAYILNGVKVVPIAILPTHYEAPAPPPPPPPPPPPQPAQPSLHQVTLHDSEDSQIMDDVLEILVENGELPASAVDACGTLDSGYLTEEAVSHADCDAADAADELQRELNDLQNELLSHADMNGGDDLEAELGVDLLAGSFHAEFPSDAAVDHDNFFGSLLASASEGGGGGGAGEPRAAEEADVDEPMDVTEESVERMCVTPLAGGDMLEHGRSCFEDMDDLSLPSFNNDDARHGDFDLKEFGIELSGEIGMDGEHFDYAATPLIPNLFGRGHVPQCDPLLGGVPAPALPAPRPQRKHYSWDRLEYDAT